MGPDSAAGSRHARFGPVATAGSNRWKGAGAVLTERCDATMTGSGSAGGEGSASTRVGCAANAGTLGASTTAVTASTAATGLGGAGTGGTSFLVFTGSTVVAG